MRQKCRGKHRQDAWPSANMCHTSTVLIRSVIGVWFGPWEAERRGRRRGGGWWKNVPSLSPVFLSYLSPPPQREKNSPDTVFPPHRSPVWAGGLRQVDAGWSRQPQKRAPLYLLPPAPRGFIKLLENHQRLLHTLLLGVLCVVGPSCGAK